MKEHFQAKDIQKIVNIPKHRYEYLGSKIGIKPDVTEVEGQGHAHLYSLKNLLQFAFVHKANSLGLTPNAARRMLIFLDWLERTQKFGIYDLNKQVRISLHYIHMAFEFFAASVLENTGSSSRFFLDGQWIEQMKLVFSQAGEEFSSLTELLDRIQKIGGIEQLLFDAFGYVTINVGHVKFVTLERLREAGERT